MNPVFETLEPRTLASAVPLLHVEWAGATPQTSLASIFAKRYQAVTHQQPTTPAPPALPAPLPPPIDLYPAEPADAGTLVPSTGPLFAPGGPLLQDVNQRSIADCYLLADLASWAAESPALIENFVRPDTTPNEYVVTFDRNNQITRVHVEADFPTWAAQPGSDGAIWAQLIEKAYACFRTAANTYASLNYGSSAATAADFGVKTASPVIGATSQQTLVQDITNALANHKMLTADTWSTAADLVASHTYAITALTTDATGTTWVTLANPWGFDDAHVPLSTLAANACDINYAL